MLAWAQLCDYLFVGRCLILGVGSADDLLAIPGQASALKHLLISMRATSGEVTNSLLRGRMEGIYGKPGRPTGWQAPRRFG